MRWRRLEKEATLIADITSRFVNLAPGDVDREIMDAARRICEFLDVDVAGLWQWSKEEPDELMLTHLHGTVAAPPPERMHASEFFPWLQGQMLGGRVSAFASLEDMPPEASRDRESLRHFGIKSNLTVPLALGGEPPIGAIGFNATTRERAWPAPLVERLQLVAQIFASALARKRADETIRAGEEKLAMAADAAAVGLWELDCRNQRFWMTPKTRLLFGFPPDETITWARFMTSVHPNDAGLVQRTLDDSLSTGLAANVEYRIRTAAGTERWIASRGRPSFARTGEPNRMQGLSMDITERRQTEEALRESEARLATGTELADLAHHEIDYAAHTCFIDEKFSSVCGIAAGHHSDLEPVKIWMQRLHPDDQQHIREEREKLHQGQVSRISMEYRFVHPTEGIKWIHHLARVTAVDEHGRVKRTHGVLRDITAGRKKELEALELRARLAHADRVTLLGQLASALAHELSQPLAAILRNAESAAILLQAARPDIEELRAIVTDICHDDHRAGLVIARLRSLLKQGVLDAKPMNLREVVSDVLALVQSDASARQVKIVSVGGSGVSRVRGDSVHLQQVLLNLIRNAMDAMHDFTERRPLIEVSVQNTGTSSVEVRVCDSGPGITPDTLARMFDPFFTTKPNGMGVGLSVSRTIVEAHHGRLWAENRPEGGACVAFTVPAYLEQPEGK